AGSLPGCIIRATLAHPADLTTMAAALHGPMPMPALLRHLLLASLILLPSALFAGETTADTVKETDDFTVISRGHGLSLHKSNYILPLTWSDDFDGESSEVIFQISFKQRLFINNLYAAYTQKSFWQAWNRQDSAPFRETNYNPE